MAIKSKARHDLTLRSIKREIAAGRDVAYWLDKAYMHLDSGLLTEEDITEIEALAQAYYDALARAQYKHWRSIQTGVPELLSVDDKQLLGLL